MLILKKSEYWGVAQTWVTKVKETEFGKCSLKTHFYSVTWNNNDQTHYIKKSFLFKVRFDTWYSGN